MNLKAGGAHYGANGYFQEAIKLYHFIPAISKCLKVLNMCWKTIYVWSHSTEY